MDEDKKKVVILCPFSQYMVLDLMAEQIASGFEEAGFEVETWLARKEEPVPDFEGKVLFTLNAVGQLAKEVSLVVDSPLLHQHRLQMPGRTFFFVDKDHLDYVPHGHFCPHGAFEWNWTEKERTIDLLLAATHRTDSPSRLVRQRAARREELLLALIESGISVTLVGSGWEQWPHLSKVDYRGPQPIEAVLEMMGEAKVTLDTPVHLGYGAHERPLTSMLAGSVTIASHNRFYVDHFTDELILYKWEERDGLPETIGELLSDDAKRQQIGRSAQKAITEGNHTWRDRARLLLSRRLL